MGSGVHVSASFHIFRFKIVATLRGGRGVTSRGFSLGEQSPGGICLQGLSLESFRTLVQFPSLMKHRRNFPPIKRYRLHLLMNGKFCQVFTDDKYRLIALGVSHVMRSINVRYLLTYFMATLLCAT